MEPKSLRWIFLLAGLIGIAVIATAIDSEDVDELCNQNGMTLFRFNNTWGCGRLNDIFYATDTYLYENVTIHNVTTIHYNVTEVLQANNTISCTYNDVYFNTTVEGTEIVWTVVV